MQIGVVHGEGNSMKIHEAAEGLQVRLDGIHRDVETYFLEVGLDLRGRKRGIDAADIRAIVQLSCLHTQVQEEDAGDLMD